MKLPHMVLNSNGRNPTVGSIVLTYIRGPGTRIC